MQWGSENSIAKKYFIFFGAYTSLNYVYDLLTETTNLGKGVKFRYFNLYCPGRCEILAGVPRKDRYESLVKHETQVKEEIMNEMKFSDDAASLRKKFRITGTKASYNKWWNLPRIKFDKNIQVLEVSPSEWDKILENPRTHYKN